MAPNVNSRDQLLLVHHTVVWPEERPDIPHKLKTPESDAGSVSKTMETSGQGKKREKVKKAAQRWGDTATGFHSDGAILDKNAN